MSQINFNRENISINLTQKVAEATGIEKYSQSSKMKLLIDLLSNEITNLAQVYNSTVDSIYSDTAQGVDLDVKGAEYGVYRKIRNSIYIDITDQMMIIRPKDSSQIFGDTILEPITIPRGEIIDVGSSFYIITSEDINIIRADSSVIVSGTIISSTNGGFNINQGDTYEMTPRNRFIDNINTLLMEFLKPLAIDGGEETDDQFRERVLLARDGSNIATIEAIESVIISTPRLSGFSTLENKRGSGSLDVGIVTEGLQQNSTDPNIDSTIRSIKSELRQVIPLGTDVLIYRPEKLNLRIEFSTGESSISDANIIDSISEAFRLVYKYNYINTLFSKDIERRLTTLLPEVSVVITSLELYDENINAIISSSSDMVIAGTGYYMFLNENDIKREEDMMDSEENA